MPSSRFESPLEITNTFSQYFDKHKNNFRLKVKPAYFRSYVRSSVRPSVRPFVRSFFLSFCLFSLSFYFLSFSPSFFLKVSFFLSFTHA